VNIVKDNTSSDIEKRSLEIIKHAPIPIYEVEFPGTKFKFVNETLCKLLGYSEEELLALNPNELLFDEGRTVIQQKVEEALRGKNLSSSSAEVRVKAKNGKSHWGLITAKVNLSLGRPDTVLIFAIDITKRKKMEEALRESEERFLEAFRNNPAAMAISNTCGQIIEINDSFERLFGYTRDEIIGKVGCDIGLYSSPEREKLINRLNEKERVVNFEMIFRHKSGKRINALFSLEPISLNKETYSLGTAIDITERKKAEEALKSSENLLAETQHIAQIGSWEWNIEKNQFTFSDELFCMFGLDKATFNLTVDSFMNIIHPPDRKIVAQSIDDVMNRHRPVKIEYRVILPDKSIKTLSAKGIISKYSNGKAIELRGIVQDITERKKAEESLREAEERFRALVESTSDVIWQVDENAVYTYVSPKIRDILGYEPEEVVGKTPFDLIATKDEEKILKAFLEIANKKEPFYGLENWNVHKNGSRVLLETSGVPILGEKGQLLGYRGIDRDITERKKLQEKLEKYSKGLEILVEERTRQLQEKERLAAIGQTAGMVGHDIRNPLQAIVSELYMVKESMAQTPQGTDKQELLESITFIEEQVDYVNKIVADLQDYAKPLNPEYAVVNLADLIVSVFDAIVLPNNIELKVNVKDNLKLKTDATFIKRAVTNLVNNAVQAMPKGGELTLTVCKRKDCVVVTVSDTGQGIPDSVKANLFKPLTTTKAKGQGLGLAVVKRLVEGLNGKVSFESEEGKGTKFLIELPS
jgi:PAS domain S-box-containing protein